GGLSVEAQPAREAGGEGARGAQRPQQVRLAVGELEGLLRRRPRRRRHRHPGARRGARGPQGRRPDRPRGCVAEEGGKGRREQLVRQRHREERSDEAISTSRSPRACGPRDNGTGQRQAIGTTAMATPIITTRGLTKVYGENGNAVHALRGIDLDVERGEFVALVGTSGSGTSTLMAILGCLDTPSAGTYA